MLTLDLTDSKRLACRGVGAQRSERLEINLVSSGKKGGKFLREIIALLLIKRIALAALGEDYINDIIGMRSIYSLGRNNIVNCTRKYLSVMIGVVGNGSDKAE